MSQVAASRPLFTVLNFPNNPGESLLGRHTIFNRLGLGRDASNFANFSRTNPKGPVTKEPVLFLFS
jgi:hypothetical protein